MKSSFDSNKNKIRCRNCKSCILESSWCYLKKSAVGLNKTRYCSLFEFDQDKFLTREKNAIESQRRSVKKAVHKPTITAPNMIDVTPEHPLTGDLSRFSTTGS